MTRTAISTTALSKQFGSTRALDGLDLEVNIGEVYGFLGPNGAGKSTTIRILLDMLRPTSGQARVFGLDPRTDALAVQRRVGYLSGDFVVAGAQSGKELLTYLGSLRGGVPANRIIGLAERLDLDLSRPIKTLSKGNRQKVGIIQAVMHEPELLVLDEPTSGLDPFLQHEFASMVREAAAEGRTVFVSSHVMSEVQQIANRVGIVRNGRLVAVEEVADLLERSSAKVAIHFEHPVRAEEFDAIEGVDDVRIDGSHLRCRLNGRADPLIKAAAAHTVISIAVEEPDLEDLFFDYYRRDGDGPGDGDGGGR